MNDLVLRKIPFNFDGVEFMWNPENPAFAITLNTVTFQAIGFEIYMCRAMRDAEKYIAVPAILAEARMFTAQESVHSLAHKKHVKALVGRYPGLQKVLDESIAGFDAIYKDEDLHFHLAYAANIEATFSPLFGMFMEQRHRLFGGGDPRISALMLWHFCEEIEHRSAALDIYNHVVGKRMFRLKMLRKVFGHIVANAAQITEGFRRNMPDVPQAAYKGAFAAIPRPAMARMLLGVAASQMPWHNPAKRPVPAYYGAWRERYDSGEDMSALHDFPAPATAA